MTGRNLSKRKTNFVWNIWRFRGNLGGLATDSEENKTDQQVMLNQVM